METAGGELAITERTIVDELITRCPAAARVLVARRMQCVGCPLARFTSVADACRAFRQPLGSVLRELNACCARCREPDTQHASGQVSGHISRERG